MTNLMTNLLLEQELNCVTGGISKKTKKGLIIGSSVVGGVILLPLIIFGIVMIAKSYNSPSTKQKSTEQKSIDKSVSQASTTTSDYANLFDVILKIPSGTQSTNFISENGLYTSGTSIEVSVKGQDGKITKKQIRALKYDPLGTTLCGLVASIDNKFVYVSEDGVFVIESYSERGGRSYQEIDIAEHINQATRPSKEYWTRQFQASTHKLSI